MLFCCCLAHVCEWGSLTIFCGAGEKIRIDYALYGRLTRRICSQHNTQHTGCRSGSSMAVVMNHCHGRQSCRLEATNGWFGDPCHGIFKYLEVRYTCITTGRKLYSYFVLALYIKFLIKTSIKASDFNMSLTKLLYGEAVPVNKGQALPTNLILAYPAFHTTVYNVLGVSIIWVDWQGG